MVFDNVQQFKNCSTYGRKNLQIDALQDFRNRCKIPAQLHFCIEDGIKNPIGGG